MPDARELVAAAYVTTQPEPTEDHLRRACEDVELYYPDFVAGKYSATLTRAVRTVARLLAERDAMQAEMTQAVALLQDHQRDIASLEAERDAMQANAWSADISAAPPACHILATRFDHGCGEWIVAVVASPPSKLFTHWRMIDTPAEPTPDPDLVLAREAAAQNANLIASAKQDLRDGKWDDHEGVQAALRALKLAKEQAHDQ